MQDSSAMFDEWLQMWPDSDTVEPQVSIQENSFRLDSLLTSSDRQALPQGYLNQTCRAFRPIVFRLIPPIIRYVGITWRNIFNKISIEPDLDVVYRG
jgi:hypothetical protein